MVALPADAPLRYLVDPGSVFAAARLSGSADFAENLAFVFATCAGTSKAIWPKRWAISPPIAWSAAEKPWRRGRKTPSVAVWRT